MRKIVRNRRFSEEQTSSQTCCSLAARARRSHSSRFFKSQIRASSNVAMTACNKLSATEIVDKQHAPFCDESRGDKNRRRRRRIVTGGVTRVTFSDEGGRTIVAHVMRFPFYTYADSGKISHRSSEIDESTEAGSRSAATTPTARYFALLSRISGS